MFRKLRFLSFLLLTAHFSGYGQVPVVTITSVNPTSGCAPLAVSFNGTASNGGSILWDFGGVPPDVTPATSISPNAAALFSKAGLYTVKLTATNASGTSTPVTVNIRIDPAPTADFNVDKTVSCFPTTINFTNTSNGNGSGIVSWIWDFGDGNLDSTNYSPSHVYKSGCTFPVTLAVQNGFGCRGKASVKNVAQAITLTPGLFPDFSTTINSSCTLPVATSFTNQTSGPPTGTLSYIWDFGDGSPTDPTVSPNHNYAAAGTYQVKLIANSTAGCTDTLVTPVTISASGNISDFTGAGNICINTVANFPNISSPSPTGANWDYGDGSPLDYRISGLHTYTTPGTYTVTLNNTFTSCTGTVAKPITVVAPPTIAFTGTNLNGCQPTLAAQFTDQTTPAAISWLWNFGDGSTSTLQNPSHNYNSYGSFPVRLVASSAPGCSNSLTKNAFVVIAKPTVVFTNAPAYGCAPFNFTPTISFTAVDGVASYKWDFGNGVTFTGPTPPAQNYPAGVYNISVTITTNGGCQVTATGVVKVGSTQPIPQFTATPTTQCVHTPIQFTDQSTGGANQWSWDFGDGGSDTVQNPTYSYKKPGVYDVTLTAYNNGCFQKLTKTAFITINPPLADFKFSFACGATSNYTFTDNSTGATGWDWDFGDGSPHSILQNPPVHIYPGTIKVYDVTLTVRNGSCSDFITKKVSVGQGTTVSVSANPVCANTLVTILTNAPANIISYTFDFGDGTQPVTGSGATTHTYLKPGNYNIVVTTKDNNGCTATSAPFAMQVAGPTVKFTTPTTVSCGALNAIFTDQSTENIGTLTSWAWDFGDATTATGQGPQTHSYNNQGIYPVKLKVTDNLGCSDSLTVASYITVSIPVAKYTTADSNYCPSSFIKFSNTSTGGFNPVYSWDFNDGTIYTGPNPPLHNFPLVRKYAVSLSIKDMYNCISSYSNPVPINIDTPNASFTMSASYSACPPLNETFTFTGHYPLTYTWNFDNGGSAIIPNPSSIYSTPGDYYPKLIVKSPGGCIATFSDHIHIDGPVGTFTYSPLAACNSLVVNFQVITSNSVSFIWNYNDGTVDSTKAPTNTSTHLYNVPGAYKPFVTLQDAAGCKVINFGNDLIEVDAITKTDFTADRTVICDTGTINFKSTTLTPGGTNITTYTWDFGDGSTVTGLYPVYPHFYNTPGVYTVTLSIGTFGGCSGTTSSQVTVVASPQVAINGLLSQCEPAVLNFSGVEVVPDPYGPLTWDWNFGNNQTATGQNPAPVSYPKAGEYVVQLIATNTKGCKDTTDTTPPSHLFIYPTPTVNAGPDTTICLGDQLQLNATGSSTSFNWLPPVNGTLTCNVCSNPIANNMTNSTYFVVAGTSIQGCASKDTIQVTVNTPVTLTVSGPDSVCVGQGAQLTASGAAIYDWTPSQGLNNPNIANPVVKPDASQAGAGPSTVINYQVTGYDNKKCFSDTKSVDITVFTYPVISLTPNATINVGSTYQLNPTVSTNIVSYSWAPSNTLSCSNCLTPIAKPSISTNYILTAVNEGGCASSDSIHIQVICNGANFFVPNSFSPNGDGVNDHFIVNGVGLNVIPSITIYNRWGQIVFQKSNFAANSAADAWDGTFNGQPAPADVYVYTIQILCDNATLIPYHGNVTLIR